MAQFTSEHLELLEYDFTGFAANSGGMCSGKGTIPEPTKQMLLDYAQAVREIFETDDLADVDPATMVADSFATEEKDEVSEELDSASDQLLDATSALCSGTPTKAQLVELPPRILRGFMKWVYREIADPEA